MGAQTSAVKITKPRTKPRTAVANTPSPRAPGGSHRAAATPSNADARVAAPPSERVRPLPANDPRLPPPGATLTRTVGEHRCECRVERDGFRYEGKLYSSLSAAARAAAHEVGLNPSQNGFIFWGLVQPSSARSPAASLTERWKHYETALRRALAGQGSEAIRRGAMEHLRALRELLQAT